MPKRARPADPDRVLDALSPTWRAAVQEARETCALGVNWQAAEALSVLTAHVAALTLAAALVEAGAADDAALEEACARLGIPANTIRTRQRRWYHATRRVLS